MHTFTLVKIFLFKRAFQLFTEDTGKYCKINIDVFFRF